MAEGARSLSVVLVEDDVTEADRLVAALEQGGCDVRVTDLAGLDQAMCRPVDVVVTDFDLAGLDLGQVLGAVRPTPVVVVSGPVETKTAVDHVKRGVSDWVLKDRPRRLVAAVEEAVERGCADHEGARAAEALRRSERRLVHAQEVAHLGSWEWDVPTDTVVWTDEMYRIYGLAPASFRPSYAGFLDRVHPEDRAHVQKVIADALASGTEFDFDHRIVRSDGVVRSLYCRGEVERDATGQAVRMTGIGQDVTESRAREEALADTLRRLGEARALAGIGNWELDLATRQVEWSEELYDLFGVDRDTFEASFDAFCALLSPEDAAELRDQVAHAEATGEGWENDLRLTMPDGQVRVFHGRAQVDRDEEGRPARIRGTRQDVTALRARETQLRDAEERFRLAIDEAPIGVALVALDGRFLRVNRALCDIVGYTAEELLRRSFQDITHPDDVGADLASIRRLLDGEIQSNQTEKRYFHARGHVVWIQLNASLARDERARPLYFITQVQDITGRKATEAVRDITERKRAESIVLSALKRERELTERLRELDRIKSDFVATVSHELRTPLTNIIGTIELLAEGDFGELSPQQARIVDVLDRNSHRLLDLIKDLLDLNQIEAGGLGLQLSPTDLGQLVERVSGQMSPQAEAKHLDLVVEVDARLGTAEVDGGQLERALVNLLSNAIKFTADQGGVSFRARRVGAGVSFVIADTGIGIPEQEKEHLFTRFFRSSIATEKAIPGSGLGLVIVKSVVEGHGGTIAVDSTVGQGTTVTVSLPLRHPLETATELTPAAV